MQLREAEREQGRQILKQQIDTWKKSQRGTLDQKAIAPTSACPKSGPQNRAGGRQR